MRTIRVNQDNNGVRLDRILRKELAHLSLSGIYGAVRKGRIKVNGRRAKQDYRVQTDDCIDVAIDDTAASATSRPDTANDTSLVHTDFYRRNFRIIFEDEWLLACDKPAGLVVHGGTKHGRHDTLIDCAKSYIHHNDGAAQTADPLLVHRLDRDTSGVILIAKNKQTLRLLHEGLRRGLFTKKYTALCHGAPPTLKGSIDCALIKTHERNRGMKVRVSGEGLNAHSRYRVVEKYTACSLMEILLDTGRTHQIRVHLSHIACPVVGDERYGDRSRDRLLFTRHAGPNRLYLHAQQISFHHPGLNREVTFASPLPDAFEKMVRFL